MSDPAPLLLLHGALAAASQFDEFVYHLDDIPSLHRIDFAGHGPAELHGEEIRLRSMAHLVLGYLDTQDIEQVRIFGYSMGGYVALMLAAHHPERVEKVMTLGTKVYWTADNAATETRKMDPDTIMEKVPAFGEGLEQLHSGLGWRIVLAETVNLIHEAVDKAFLSDEVFASIEVPVRVAVGDRDTTVPIEEAARTYRALPNAQLEVFPGTPHPFERVDLARLAESLRGFME